MSWLKEHFLPTSCFGRLRTLTIDTIVLHYPAPNALFANPYSEEAVYANLCVHKLSYHYYVHKDGTVTQWVKDKYVAYHAGLSELHGEININSRSIGVCFENNGGEEYSLEQVEGARDLCIPLVINNTIPLNRIVGHCHVSPERRQDPGPKFPWYGFLVSIGKEIL